MNKSKFAGVFAARETMPVTEEVEPVPVVPPMPLQTATENETRRPGRPAGKRSDPDMTQVTAYIRRQTHKAVKIALLQEEEQREFSELVEELLAEWLNSRT